MASKQIEVYKGKRRRKSITGLVLLIIAVLLVGTVVTFYALQQYIVYGHEGMELVLPMLATPVPTNDAGVSQFEKVNTQLEMAAADYSAAEAVGGADTPSIGALFVPADALLSDKLSTYIELMPMYDANALVLEMKPESGQLLWPSGSQVAQDFATNGTLELGAKLQELKKNEVYLVAQISCLVDGQLAQRGPSNVLRGGGGAYSDESGTWLDPYSGTVRQYVEELCRDLYALGFDEVLLTHVVLPEEEGSFGFNAQLSYTPTPKGALCGFAGDLVRRLEDCDVQLSVMMDPDTMMNATSEKTGQDSTYFCKMFDRVCCPAGTAWEYGVYRDLLVSKLTLGNAYWRCASVMNFAPDGAESWIVLVPDILINGPEEED